MNRRAFLARAGSVGVIGTPLASGCLESTDAESPSEESPENETDPTPENGTPTGDGSVDDPAEDDDGPVWTHDVGGAVDAVANGRVFGRENFGDEDGDGGVFALDAATGEHEWTDGATGGYTGYTPLTVDNALYFGFGDDAIGSGSGSVHAFEFDGEERWTRQTGSVYDRPIVADGICYAGGDDGAVYAFETADGEERWSTDDLGGEDPSEVTVAAVGDVVYVATGQLLALGPDDGEVLWRFGEANGRIRDATVVDGVAYVTDRDGVAAVADGEERWRADFEQNRWIRAVESGRVIVEHGYDLHALDAADGDDAWVQEFDERPAVAVHGDRAYVASEAGPDLRALAVESGDDRWTEAVGEEPIESIRVHEDGDDHAVFVRTGDAALHRVTPDGEIAWTGTVDDDIRSVFVDDLAYVGGREGIYALDPW